MEETNKKIGKWPAMPIHLNSAECCLLAYQVSSLHASIRSISINITVWSLTFERHPICHAIVFLILPLKPKIWKVYISKRFGQESWFSWRSMCFLCAWWWCLSTHALLVLGSGGMLLHPRKRGFLVGPKSDRNATATLSGRQVSSLYPAVVKLNALDSNLWHLFSCHPSLC